MEAEEGWVGPVVWAREGGRAIIIEPREKKIARFGEVGCSCFFVHGTLFFFLSFLLTQMEDEIPSSPSSLCVPVVEDAMPQQPKKPDNSGCQ